MQLLYEQRNMSPKQEIQVLYVYSKLTIDSNSMIFFADILTATLLFPYSHLFEEA